MHSQRQGHKSKSRNLLINYQFTDSDKQDADMKLNNAFDILFEEVLKCENLS